ncbi:excinuclease ABC subunit A [Sagittula sp. NFXS13]|uniref:excinuclease ABC subunit A n=1 Tax=Sagittula sp. NFXS13 TaxID=2819095 RepID=UPI0032DE9D67
MFRTLTAATLAVATLSMPIAAQAGSAGCPQGLAQKNNGCMAPGQAKKQPASNDHADIIVLAPGDRLSGEYRRIDDPSQYGLNPHRAYYRVNDQIYRVDRHTKEVLDVIGAVAALAN